MIFYIIMYIYLFILSIFSIYINKDKLKFAYVVFSVYLIFFVGLRNELGGYDYSVYKAYFENVPKLNEISSFNYFIKYEPLYTLFNSIIKTFTNNHYYLFLMIAISTLSVLLYYNFKLVKYPFFTIMFYFYKTLFYSNFVAMRQSFSIVIFIISIKYLINKNVKKYILLNILAGLFHSSTFLMIPLYFINKVDLSKYSIKIIVYFAILLKFLNKPIMIIVCGIFDLLGIEGISKGILNLTSNNGVNLHLIEGIILFFIFNKIKNKLNSSEKIYYNLFIIYFITLFVFSNYPMFIRMSMYFYISIMVMLSKYIESIKSSIGKVNCIYFLGIIFFIGYIKYIIQFDGGSLINYKFITIDLLK